MSDRKIREWVLAWESQYPRKSDQVLLSLHGRRGFTIKELEVILAWKLEATKNFLATALRHLRSLPEGYVIDIVARALTNPDDLGAMLLLLDIKGIQEPIASAILMTSDPDRFTVIDRRAKRSLAALGELQTSPERGEWLNYLESCRDLSRRTLVGLRAVDRALFWANGRIGFPSDFEEPKPHWFGALT